MLTAICIYLLQSNVHLKAQKLCKIWYLAKLVEYV